MDTIIQPVTTKAKRGPYRLHSDEFKRAAVARTLVAGASVSLIARELKINTNQLFSWRKRFADKALAGGTAPSQLVAVTVLDTPLAPIPAASVPSGVTDMRAGMNGLTAKAQTALAEDPYSGHVFLFRGRRGDMVKVLWWSGDGLCLLAKRLERGRFVWPQAGSGSVALTQAQLSMLLEGIDWRRPERTWRPTSAL